MSKIFLITIILILIISILTLSQTQLIKLNQKPISLNLSSFTKAVCENNYCQDYLFECNDTKITAISPITGAAVQFDNKWKDPRNKNQIAKTC